MQDILKAIEKYLIGAIPTAALFIVLVVAYQFLIQEPLTAALAKRRALTEALPVLERITKDLKPVRS